MATEKELALNVQDFMGISRRVISKQLPNNYFDTLQNLYEPKLNRLQRRGGTSKINLTLPSNIASIDNAHVMYLNNNIKRKIVAAHATYQSTPVGVVTTDFTAAFVADAAGFWDTVIVVNRAQLNATNIYLEFVGPGISQIYKTATSPAAVQSRLDVTITKDMSPNVTGCNVYAACQTFPNATTPSEAANKALMWIGFIDLQTTHTGTFSFFYAPITQFGTSATAYVAGDSLPTFDLVGTTGGSLTPNKTYYVMVLSNHFQADSSLGSMVDHWKAAGVTSVASITLSSTQNKIDIQNILGSSSAYLIAVGEDPQLLQPIYITNVTTSNMVGTIPPSNPGLIDFVWTDATTMKFVFIYADYSVNDILIKWEGTAVTPIYPARLTTLNQANKIGPPNPDANFLATYYADRDKVPYPKGAKYCFTDIGQKLFYTSDYNSSYAFSVTGVTATERSTSGVYQTDGVAAGTTIIDFGTSEPPRTKYCFTYQESLVVGGSEFSSDAAGGIYWTNAYNPYNWSQSGSGTDLAFLQLEASGFPITGIGVYTNSTSINQPTSPLVVFKRHSSWLLSGLPQTFTTANTFTQLSGRVGCVGMQTIAYTDVGTMFASDDNVYLLRGDGEPTPIGDDIGDILKPEDPSIVLDTTYWNAMYHDEHYKLAFTAQSELSIESMPTIELWLNIRKMKANKGQPCWYGPNIGRNIAYSLLEYSEDPTFTQRPQRITIDLTQMAYADDPSVVVDLSSVSISVVLKTKNFTGDQADHMNKLLIRNYYSFSVDQSMTFTELTSIDEGTYTETLSLVVNPLPGYSNVTLNRYGYWLANQRNVDYPFFPTLRLRGQMIQKTLSYTGPVFFSISSLSVFYKPERRRI